MEIKRRRREYYKKYREKNIIKCLEYSKKYRQDNPEYYKKYRRKYYLDNIDRIKDRVGEYQLKHPNKRKEADKKYRETHKEKIKKYKKEWCKNNPEKIKNASKIYRNNPIYKLNHNISNAISTSLHGKKDGLHWEELVGYTQKDLRNHLEKQFRDGMTWENYGRNGWHIDHRIPKSIFNITSYKSKGFKACWALDNLQPLWAKENSEKNNKLFY